MWYPPSLLIPMYFEPNVFPFAARPAPVMWSALPAQQHFSFHSDGLCLSEEGRKFLLSKSVYELVKVNHYLELTNSKLLGWYLSLPPEDRKLIQAEGGLIQFLHRHPALEVFRQVVYLKQYTIGNGCTFPELKMSSKLDGSKLAPTYGQTRCINCVTNTSYSVEKCRCFSTVFLNQEETLCMREEEKLCLLPNNVREELNLLKSKEHASEDMATWSSRQSDCMQSLSTNRSSVACNLSSSFQQPKQPSYNSDGQRLFQMWDGKEVQMFKDHLLLERKDQLLSQHHSSDQDPVPLQPDNDPEFPNHEKEPLPEYYSFNSTTEKRKCTQRDDATNTPIMATGHSNEATTDDKSTTFAENCKFSDSISFRSFCSEWTDLIDDSQNLSSEDEYEDHRANEETGSSPNINPSRSASDQDTQSECTRKGCNLSTSLSQLNVKNRKCEVSSVSIHASQTVDASSDIGVCFTSTQTTKVTQDLVLKSCQDVSISTDLSLVDQETQTIPQLSVEKSTTTEVCMSDLDAICQEFEQFRKVEEELLRLKDERSDAKEAKNKQQQFQCRCGALSRAISAELRLLALQFAMCWQHCWRSFYTSTAVETSVQRFEEVPDSQTLKSLEDQYLKMKCMILEGVPLENLKPLSVDTKRLKAETCYTPSLIYETLLQGHLSESSCNGLQDECQINPSDKPRPLNKTETVSQHECATSKTINSKQGRKGSNEADPGVPKDLSSSDALFNAQEDILSMMVRVPPNENVVQIFAFFLLKRFTKESIFYIPFVVVDANRLPNAVDEELPLGSAKDNTTQVSISNLINTRVSKVSDRKPINAETAVMEMNEQSIHVQHLQKPSANDHITIKEYCVKPPQNNLVASGALHCSPDKMINISTTPTATGTCVPQHYGTMGSFDAIMGQLLQHHSNVGRLQIIDALLKLQIKNRGVLAGLPLKEIVNMTSELLTHSTTD